MWRARSYEDFDTQYTIANNECHISSVTAVCGHGQVRDRVAGYAAAVRTGLTKNTTAKAIANTT